MWLIPAILGVFVAYKLLAKHKNSSVENVDQQEIFKEYNDILEKLDVSSYGPFTRVSPLTGQLVWTTPDNKKIVITVAKNKVFNKLVAEIGIHFRGRYHSETTTLSNTSSPPSQQIVSILTRMLRASTG
jgi:hypothetical protein